MSLFVQDLNDYRGSARVFPLPGFVMFPHVKKALHVFEPRYRQMTADALADDKFLILVQAGEGWERDYEGRVPVQPIGCLVRIEHHQPVGDGRSNLLVRGVCRVRLEKELLASTAYRTFEAVPLLDPPGQSLPRLKAELAQRMQAWFGGSGPALAQFQELLNAQLPVGNLCDILAFFLLLETEQKQRLLAELDVEKRALFLLDLLAAPPASAPAPPPPRRPLRYPPEFSNN